MKKIFIFYFYFVYSFFIVMPLVILNYFLFGILGEFIENVILDNKVYNYLCAYFDVYNLIDYAKEQLVVIMSSATYKTDICDATNFIDRFINRKEFDIISQKQKNKIKEELTDYLFNEVVPMFRYRIAIF